MEEYIEDYTYNKSFWMKTGVLYSHTEKKFIEYLSVGEVFKKFGHILKECSEKLSSIENYYKPIENETSTLSKGIKVMIKYIKNISENMKFLAKDIDLIVKNIEDKKDGYNSKKAVMEMCENEHKKFQEELEKLNTCKDNYFSSINEAIENYLFLKMKGKEKKQGSKILNDIENRRNEYKSQVEIVEKVRVNYMEIQGNIFSYEEEFERECTNELKRFFINMIEAIENCKTKITLNETDKEIIDGMNGELDNKQFAEKNKSLMTGPKRNLYKEYSQDINYYLEHFSFLKKEVKGKNSKEMRKYCNQISQDVSKFLSTIIKEEPDQIREKILEISKKIKENNCKEDEYMYIENKFQERFNQFMEWKNKNIIDQDFKKVGAEWDDRFSYMHIFLGFFNKTRVGNKELDATNFGYLNKLIIKILELNDNEDIDFNLCDLVVILSSTFYTKDPTKKTGKKYINEVIKETPIMQKQPFWVGLTKFELNEEIQQQKKETETLNENIISEEKINNSIIAKLMSISYNTIQFVKESNTFNRILKDVFKYCKIDQTGKETVVSMIESQIKAEDIKHIQIDRELLFS
jgi:hypothetical protein